MNWMNENVCKVNEQILYFCIIDIYDIGSERKAGEGQHRRGVHHTLSSCRSHNKNIFLNDLSLDSLIL